MRTEGDSKEDACVKDNGSDRRVFDEMNEADEAGTVAQKAGPAQLDIQPAAEATAFSLFDPYSRSATF